MLISIRCPDCTRQISFIRLKTGEGVCQVCGCIVKPEEVKKQREEQLKEQGK
jgi:transcription initiation factor TFIIIB Brf1 subunit/transcription initiation factor TFIIB